MSNVLSLARVRAALRLAALLALSIHPDPARAQSALALGTWCGGVAPNPVVAENCKMGNPPEEWDGIVGAGDPSVQGYAADISVNRGQPVQFKIKAPGVTAYRLDIYRIGYYFGNGARKVATVLPSAPLPQTQPECPPPQASTGLVDCGNWQVSATWPGSATANMVSGLYLAKLIRTDTGGASHIPFVIRDDARNADLLFQTSDTTWQAYNDYGGYSLYVAAVPPPSTTGGAFKVSYNRPFNTRQTHRESWFLRSEYPMIRWLEANGYDVAYVTGVDSDRYGSLILNHGAFLSVGHDEYWSRGQREKVEAARAAGVHLAFFSGNEVYWKTRWEASAFAPDGSAGSTPYRTLVCYKETNTGFPNFTHIDPLPNTTTAAWRDPRFGPPISPQLDGFRPENALTGTISTGANPPSPWIEVPATIGKTQPFWRNTGMEVLADNYVTYLPPLTMGWEFDSDYANGVRPAGLVQLSSTTRCVNYIITPDYGIWSVRDPCVNVTHNLTFYTLGTSRVFGAGTPDWSWGLDPVHDASTSCDPYGLAHCHADWRMQQATSNLFTDMGVTAATPRLYPRLYPANGDFGGNGVPDLLWYDQTTGAVRLWLDSSEKAAYVVGSVADLDWQIITVGDFNGDGRSELLWRHRLSGDVRMWRINPFLETFEEIAVASVPRQWRIVGTGDFNGDGKDDILWRYGPLVQMWLMNGAVISQNVEVGQLAATWWVVGLGDFNGDGKGDVLWRSQATGEARLWTMNGTVIVSDVALSAQIGDPNWVIVGTGDHDGDGKADVLWQYRSGDHRLSGLVYAWLMNGAQRLAVVDMKSRFPDLNWEVVGAGDLDANGMADMFWRNGVTGEVMFTPVGPSGSSIEVIDKVGLGADHLNWVLVASP